MLSGMHAVTSPAFLFLSSADEETPRLRSVVAFRRREQVLSGVDVTSGVCDLEPAAEDESSTGEDL